MICTPEAVDQHDAEGLVVFLQGVALDENGDGPGDLVAPKWMLPLGRPSLPPRAS
jgi:hypothetical protein